MSHDKEQAIATPPRLTRRLMKEICNCGGRPHRGGRRRCSIVTDSPVKRPDLAIYSQVEELLEGRVPSWDSPDITTNHWEPFRLMDEARVKVRNNSTDTAAANALVHYYLAPFGIGTPRTLFQTRQVGISPSSEVLLNFPLDSATLDGDPRVGVHIVIEHPNDPNLVNNAGSQVHDGSYTSDVGRTHSIQIPVANDTDLSRTMQLSVLTTDVIASVTPLSHSFAPHEQIIATLDIEVPGFLSGTPADPIHRGVTVVARLASGELIGGATKLLRIDN